jgi:hypothetical protein
MCIIASNSSNCARSGLAAEASRFTLAALRGLEPTIFDGRYFGLLVLGAISTH